ncbi:hypothetical protein AOQ84DRAFT_365818 [Glonium stellatum]|uniref:Uncharacterized protein n=1 Tax=Glonium stellatum TaxID=574774 RepID=A0A8E2EWX9_9PEZI|nr:hypothetical protein AOQ84DRAFT_365818 [Glonium stellatum]
MKQSTEFDQYLQEPSPQRAASCSRISGEGPFSDAYQVGQDEDADYISEREQGDKGHRRPSDANRDDGSADSGRGSFERFPSQLASSITATTATGFRNASRAIDVTSTENLSPEELRQLVHRLQCRIQDQQLQLNQAKGVLLQEHTGRYQGLSDESLAKQMTALRAEIFEWSGAHFTHDGGNYSKSKAVHRFRHLVSDHEAYLGSCVLRPWLIQARLWDLLQENIFGDDRKYFGFIWACGIARRRFYTVTSPHERISRNMLPLDVILKPDVDDKNRLAWKEYIEWRSLTFNLLCPGNGKSIRPKISQDEIHSQIDIVTNRIWKSLKGYKKTNRELARASDAKSELQEIVRNSVLLDLDLKKQMADFVVKRFKSAHQSGSVRNQYGFRFESYEMVDVSVTSSGKVDMVVSPALYKYEDWSEGVCEGNAACILKAEVFRRQLPRPETTHTPGPKQSRQVIVTRPKRPSKKTSSARSK